MILQGDALEVLRTLDSESVNCVVTSPPYWGLRDYGVAGQLGLEKTPEEFVAKMVEVFREVRRVLSADGTLWLNIGDSYCATGMGGGTNSKEDGRNIIGSGKRKTPPGLKPKDLVGIPWMLAFALRADGWFLRSDIIWSKPNPMPESVRDRPTKAHEYIFLLSKSAKYFYDADAVAEPATSGERFHGDYGKPGILRPQSERNGRHDEANTLANRNARTVWHIATQPYPETHFATFPEEIPRRCILAGCQEGGLVLDPFAGSGTTLAVAIRLGRRGLGIELNPEYIELAEKRIADETPSLFVDPGESERRRP